MYKPTCLQEYLISLPKESKAAIETIRSVIQKTAPNAVEGFSYGIGAFSLNNKYFIYYSGYKNHISIYPAPRTHVDFEEELKQYKGGKGTVRFPLHQPLPIELIQRIILHLIKEHETNIEKNTIQTQHKSTS